MTFVQSFNKDYNNISLLMLARQEIDSQFKSGYGVLNPPIVHAIGNTPLLELQYPENPNVKIFAKAEWLNPGGSVKDRAAWGMLRAGLVSGDLSSTKTILEATSGNTGIALAMIGASLGIKVKICIPKNASPERLKLLQMYGAELELTDPLEGTDGAILKARQLFKDNPNEYFYTDQYSNEQNWLSHYNGTALEIIEQTGGNITHFVAGLGTSGTFIGTAKRLKEVLPKVKNISVQPDGPFHGMEGMKHMESVLIPSIYSDEVADDNLFISTEDAYRSTLDLARNHGLLVGISSGAAYSVARKLASELETGIIVIIFPDRGERYMTDKFWGFKK